MRFKIFSHSNQHGRRWYFHARAGGNHEIVLRSEGYHNHADCVATVDEIRRDAGNASLDDSEHENERKRR